MLSQGLMDRLARDVIRLKGTLQEQVVYTHKVTATATPVVSTVLLHLAGYRQRDLDMDLILPNDQKARIATAAILFAPTRFDQFVRPDGRTWRVMQVADGPGKPFWTLQCRQVA